MVSSFTSLLTKFLLVLPLFTVVSVLSQTCYHNVTCEALGAPTTCLGASVAFTHTSLIFANDSRSLSDAKKNLELWTLLKRVPECWAVVQPFLCSVYLPRCNNTLNRVELPSRDLCERTRGPCAIVEKYNSKWPTFLQCNQWPFQNSCDDNYYEKDVTFDTAGSCVAPLIRTTVESNWYEEVKGCGIQCQNPLYTEDEHSVVHIFIAVCGSLCIASTLFCVLTFIIDWKNAHRYPALILFFINACYFLSSIGWMVQFSSNVRKDVVCRSDGTIRKEEPQIRAGESASCTIIFILVYYFTIAGLVWFAVLAYAWDLTFSAIGTMRDNLTSKTSYFHIISWCLPLVLSIICLTISQVDADSVSGICFIGYYNKAARGGFVLAPVGLSFLIGTVLLIKGLRTMLAVQKDTPVFLSEKAVSKIKGTIIRLFIFIILGIVFVGITFIVHLYTFLRESSWEVNFRSYLYCQAREAVNHINSNYTIPTGHCQIEDRPSVVAVLFHIFVYFGSGISMSSWAWTWSSLDAWERFLRKVFRIPSSKPVKMKKHKLIAKAFERRQEMNNGRLSISFGSTHDDPLGMKFDMNSASSHSVSSTFHAAMPKLVRRRGGMMHPIAGTLRRYSDSDIASLASYLSKISKGSHRESIESAMSRKLNDLDKELLEMELRRRQRRKRKKKRRMRRNAIQPVFQPISSAMQALHHVKKKRHGVRHRRRRHGSATSGTSDVSNQNGAIAAIEQPAIERNSLSSQILSDSVTTNDDSMDSSIFPEPAMPNYSLFTASSFLPTLQAMGDNSSQHGSIRRGRRREVKLEMTETSFYHEDDDQIEIGGSRTINSHSECQEEGSIDMAGTKNNPKMANTQLGSASHRGNGGRNSHDTSQWGSFSSKGSRQDLRQTRQGSASSHGSKTQDVCKTGVASKNSAVRHPQDTERVGSAGKKRDRKGLVVNSDIKQKVGSASSHSSRGTYTGSSSSRIGSGSSNSSRLLTENRMDSKTSYSRHNQELDRQSSPRAHTNTPDSQFGEPRIELSDDALDEMQPDYPHEPRIMINTNPLLTSRSDRSRIYSDCQNGPASSKNSPAIKKKGNKSKANDSFDFSNFTFHNALIPGLQGETIMDLVAYENEETDEDEDDFTEVSSLQY
ncbi:hypothetical protein ACJMK2_003870 [Sinanodonta woodiana]|uniref:Smoothened n=1 Tax=Sinanodonta woodiana TaxID=1069815 RepID=A0ABD3Y1F1_SINWO